ncbi:MAG: right-handed parallel beta-helix repeat-containing protein [Candidatus Hodarchaeota archaeon]
MKKINFVRFLAIILLLGSLISVFMLLIDNNIRNSIIIGNVSSEVKTSGIHLPIVIDGNADFIPTNGVSPGGNGTYENPYIIEDLIIDTAGADDCILINNTNVYFKIKNCTLVNSGVSIDKTTIKLNNVTNGLIWNNTISLAGIFILDSHNNSISNNIIHNNSSIFLNLSNNNTIANNTITESKDIHLLFSNNNKILNNYIQNNTIGIKLQFSLNNTIQANEIYDCEEYGIAIWSASNFTRVIQNYIYNNGIDEIDKDADSLNCLLEGNIFAYREDGDGEPPKPEPELFLLYLIILIISITAVTAASVFLYRRYLRKKEHKHPEPGEQESYEPVESPYHVDLPEPPDLDQDDLDFESS